ncbi:CRISPR-associated endonuclease Cas2 [Halobaculum sp. MBLA0143]|uniref:CRISPR-associated endonuclease Cas2 n=1 Tax=Halobaculum sp. MBLA0143 TaxID=3079933 RepID=UPI003525D9B1
MFVLVTYDVSAERTRIYRKLLRRYLEHIQNSVFHGELTEGQLATVKGEIRDELEPDDSLYVFTAEIAASVDCTVLGDAEEPGSRFT